MEAVKLRLLLDGFLHSFDHFVVEELLVELLSLDKHASFLAKFAPKVLELREHVPRAINVLLVRQWTIQLIMYDLDLESLDVDEQLNEPERGQNRAIGLLV